MTDAREDRDRHWGWGGRFLGRRNNGIVAETGEEGVCSV